MDNNHVDIFLDSGAFSAFTQGVDIDLEEYANFIKDHKKHLQVYANLDVIGSAKGTYKNQLALERLGVDPLPCFHYGEDPKWLKKYIARGYDYIALGGMVPISSKDLRPWLDDIFTNYLTDDKGMPIIKVHGFGLTAYKLMKRYPWYSVDSTSWVVTGRLGGIYVPRRINGEINYDQDAWKIQVSNRSPSKKEAGKHLETLTPTYKKEILRYIEEKGYSLGVSEFKTVDFKDYGLQESEKWAGKEKDGQREVETIIEPGISNDYKLRDEMNIIYFLDLEKSWRKWPWAFKVKRAQGFL